MTPKKTATSEKEAVIASIIREFRLVIRAVLAHNAMVEKISGLNSTQMRMLYEVSQQPSVKVSTLAQTLIIHQSTCSNLVDKLRKKGLLSKERSLVDQRKVAVMITPEGQKIVSSFKGHFEGPLYAALANTSDSDLKALEKELSNLTNSMQLSKKQADYLTPIDMITKEIERQ